MDEADVAACLVAACADEGPLSEAHVMLCAEYVAYTRERFVAKRTISALKTNMSRFEMNTGVPPRIGLVPFGTAGWCFIPGKLRQRRHAPKYERAEPVLCVGYQHMYTTVYRCLTRHNTVVHSEQVYWDLKQPLGVFLSVKTGPPVKAPEKAPKLLDVDLFAEKQKPAAPADKKASSLPQGILRLNKAKVFDSDGRPRPKPYILERIKAVDGLSVEEACKLEFPDLHGKLRPYRRDINYDLFQSEWIRIERSAEHESGAAAAAFSERATAHPQEAKRPEEDLFPETATEESKQKCFLMFHAK